MPSTPPGSPSFRFAPAFRAACRGPFFAFPRPTSARLGQIPFRNNLENRMWSLTFVQRSDFEGAVLGCLRFKRRSVFQKEENPGIRVQLSAPGCNCTECSCLCCLNKTITRSIVSRSQLDELCLLPNSVSIQLRMHGPNFGR